MKNYSKHDQELIEKANSLYCDEWGEIDENAAESPEAKYELHTIKMHLYHKEEGRDI